MSDTSERAVAATLARIGAAWDAGDATAYAAEFTEDATYVAFNGAVARGRAEIESTHRFLFAGPLSGSRMAAAGAAAPAQEIRLVAPGVVHVLATGGGVQLAGTATLGAGRASVVSFVLVEDGGAWSITAFQNTRDAS